MSNNHYNFHRCRIWCVNYECVWLQCSPCRHRPYSQLEECRQSGVSYSDWYCSACIIQQVNITGTLPSGGSQQVDISRGDFPPGVGDKGVTGSLLTRANSHHLCAWSVCQEPKELFKQIIELAIYKTPFTRFNCPKPLSVCCIGRLFSSFSNSIYITT